jgi:predicted porin
MNLKTSAIALAVAGAVAAPVAVQADSGFYGSVRIGFQYYDGGFTGSPATDQTTIRGYGSRFGFSGETDMGNGLTGFGKYEVGIDTDTSGLNISGRHAFVGVKGDFGKVYLGRTYHTWYNFISGPLDNPWWGAGYTWHNYTGRTNQAITYAGGSGNFGFGASLYMDSSSTDTGGSANDLDKFEIAANWQAGPVLLAIGYSDQDEIGGFDPGEVIGLTASGWETGIFTWGLSYTMQDDIDGLLPQIDATGIAFDVLIGNGYVHYESIDLESGSVSITPTTITLGYTQSIGRQTTVWYEYQATDYDVGASSTDLTVGRVVLKYDWK